MRPSHVYSNLNITTPNSKFTEKSYRNNRVKLKAISEFGFVNTHYKNCFFIELCCIEILFLLLSLLQFAKNCRKVSSVLVTLTSRRDFQFERSHIRFHKAKLDGVELNFVVTTTFERIKEKFYGFLQTELFLASLRRANKMGGECC